MEKHACKKHALCLDREFRIQKYAEKKKLWVKGETSGTEFEKAEIRRMVREEELRSKIKDYRDTKEYKILKANYKGDTDSA